MTLIKIRDKNLNVDTVHFINKMVCPLDLLQQRVLNIYRKKIESLPESNKHLVILTLAMISVQKFHRGKGSLLPFPKTNECANIIFISSARSHGTKC